MIFLLISVYLWDYSKKKRKKKHLIFSVFPRKLHLRLWINRTVLCGRTITCWRCVSTRRPAGRTPTVPSATPLSSSTSSEKKARVERDPSSSMMGRVSFYLQKCRGFISQWCVISHGVCCAGLEGRVLVCFVPWTPWSTSWRRRTVWTSIRPPEWWTSWGRGSSMILWEDCNIRKMIFVLFCLQGEKNKDAIGKYFIIFLITNILYQNSKGKKLELWNIILELRGKKVRIVK